MNHMNLKLGLVLLAITPLSAQAGQSVDERWNVDADVSVSIENVAGEIEIQGWDRDEARLTGELGDSVDKLEVSESGSSLRIIVVNRDERNVDNTELRLMAPTGANIDVSTVSADITITGMDNETLTAGSVSGDVDIEASSGRVSIESVSGDVTFEGGTSRISAESVSGDVQLAGISGDLEATTVSGDMELDAGVINSGKLETVSGDLGLEGELADNGRLTVESMSGDVTIMLPDSQTGTFRAQSFSGRISTDFGSVKHARHGPGSHLKHVEGDGNAQIRVESFSGNIELLKD